MTRNMKLTFPKRTPRLVQVCVSNALVRDSPDSTSGGSGASLDLAGRAKEVVLKWFRSVSLRNVSKQCWFRVGSEHYGTSGFGDTRVTLYPPLKIMESLFLKVQGPTPPPSQRIDLTLEKSKVHPPLPLEGPRDPPNAAENGRKMRLSDLQVIFTGFPRVWRVDLTF